MVGIIRCGMLTAAAFASLVSFASASAPAIPTTYISINTLYEEPPPLHPFLQAYLNGTLTNASTPSPGASHDDGPLLTCYNQCYGIERTHAVDSINWFCSAFGNGVFTTPRSIMGSFGHSIDLHVGVWEWYEEPWINLTMSVPDGADCDPALIMTFESCASNMLDCVDGCNTNGVDGKQGGYVDWGCLRYQWQPNPYCYPDCLTDTPWNSTDPSSMICLPKPSNAGPKRNTLDAQSFADTYTSETTKADTKHEVERPSNEGRDSSDYGGTIVGSNEAVVSSDARIIEASKSDADYTTVDCYNQCYGVDRSVILDAVNWFCSAFDNFTFYTVQNYIDGSWTYAPSLSVFGSDPNDPIYEEGLIALSVTVPTGCDEATYMPFEACQSNMLAITDWCNTETENGKQGGNAYTGCLKFELQPNPRCWPECLAAPYTPAGTAECALPS